MKVRNFSWKVKIEESAEKIFHSRKLSSEDREIIYKWAKEVESYGPDALLKKPGVWADHPLFGEWEGYRASSFSYSGRIIYRIENQIITVVVVRISPDHDYKK